MKAKSVKIQNLIVAAACMAAAASATAQVAFSVNLSAIGGSGVTATLSGTYQNILTGALTGGGAATFSGTQVIVPPNPGPADVTVPTITSVVITGANSFSAPLTVGTPSVTIGSDGSVDKGPAPAGTYPVFVSVKTATWNLSIPSGTSLAFGPDTYTVTLYNGATALSSGTFNATVVPEPETYAAAAAFGLVGFGLWRRRNA